MIAVGKKCFIKLDEKNTGQFFGQCPIESYSSDAVEPVSDSSRYFVLKLVNEDSGRSAFVGIGFIDRSDSFDLNVALQDHFKCVHSTDFFFLFLYFIISVFDFSTESSNMKKRIMMIQNKLFQSLILASKMDKQSKLI